VNIVAIVPIRNFENIGIAGRIVACVLRTEAIQIFIPFIITSIVKVLFVVKADNVLAIWERVKLVQAIEAGCLLGNLVTLISVWRRHICVVDCHLGVLYTPLPAILDTVVVDIVPDTIPKQITLCRRAMGNGCDTTRTVVEDMEFSDINRVHQKILVCIFAKCHNGNAVSDSILVVWILGVVVPFAVRTHPRVMFVKIRVNKFNTMHRLW